MTIINPEGKVPLAGNPSQTLRANPGNATTRATYISGDTKITGEIRSKTGLVVDGEVEGQLKLDDEVVIGTSGVVTGEIVAQTVRVAGKVRGSVRGLKLVELQSTGSIEGDVSAPRVVISDGAFFKGNVEMGEQPHADATRPRRP